MPATPSPRDQLPAGDVGPWIATFRDGPLADHDHDRIFAVGPIWQTITLVDLPGPQDWAIVAGDGIPLEIPRTPWEGEVTYRLADIVPLAGADGEPVAYYEMAGLRTLEPTDRLTGIASELVKALKAEPGVTDDVQAIVILREGDKGGIAVRGWEHPGEVVLELLTITRKLVEQQLPSGAYDDQRSRRE